MSGHESYCNGRCCSDYGQPDPLSLRNPTCLYFDREGPDRRPHRIFDPTTDVSDRGAWKRHTLFAYGVGEGTYRGSDLLDINVTCIYLAEIRNICILELRASTKEGRSK